MHIYPEYIYEVFADVIMCQSCTSSDIFYFQRKGLDLNRFSNVYTCNTDWISCPLFVMCEIKNISMIQQLLDNGADPNITYTTYDGSKLSIVDSLLYNLDIADQKEFEDMESIVTLLTAYGWL